MTGSLFRYRSMSFAKPFYRFVSPRTVLFERLHDYPIQVAFQERNQFWAAPPCRRSAMACSSAPCSVVKIREGRCGSVSRNVRRSSPRPECASSLLSKGVLPVSTRRALLPGCRYRCGCPHPIRSPRPVPGSCKPACRRACSDGVKAFAESACPR